MSSYEIVLLGDQDPAVVAHQAIPKALALAAAELDISLRPRWLPTEMAASALAACDGLWCVPGSPYRNPEGALAVIRTVRERDIPFLGTCGGLQHSLLEQARTLPGWADVAHAEEEPAAQRALLTPLSCARVEFRNRLRLLPGSRLVGGDGRETAEAAYHCRFGVNPDYLPALLAAGWRILAWDDEGLPVAFELERQACHFGTLYQPEREALEGRVPVAVRAWLAAVVARRGWAL